MWRRWVWVFPLLVLICGIARADQLNPVRAVQLASEQIVTHQDMAMLGSSPVSLGVLAVPITPIPEPRSIILLGTTLLLVSTIARRRSVRKANTR